MEVKAKIHDPASPLVSIIINCFNGQDFLREAIESVYRQTYENWEIVFWDNGSTDCSADIAKSFGTRIRYFYNANTVPLGEARNRAIKLAEGKYLSFLDCDDLLEKTFLEESISLMESKNYALVYSSVIFIDSKGQDVGDIKLKPISGNIFGHLLRNFDISVIGTLIRKSSLLMNDLSFDKNIKASEEYCLFMQLAVNNEFATISKPLARYRKLENSLTNKSIHLWAKERKYTLDKIVSENPNIQNSYRKEFTEAYARGTYYQARYLMHIGEKKQAIKTMFKVAGVNYKYSLLFIVSLLPIKIWNKLHFEKHQR